MSTYSGKFQLIFSYTIVRVFSINSRLVYPLDFSFLKTNPMYNFRHIVSLLVSDFVTFVSSPKLKRFGTRRPWKIYKIVTVTSYQLCSTFGPIVERYHRFFYFRRASSVIKRISNSMLSISIFTMVV